MEGRAIGLKEYNKYLPEIKKQGVSKTARSKGHIVDQVKKAGGVQGLPKKWKEKREDFIARHMAQYKKNPTYRRFLALIAWFFKPDKSFGTDGKKNF